MGTIINGANGGFSGKAGSVIGSSWKSINYIKGLYKKRSKPATQAQREQQEKFKQVMRFLLPINVFIAIGYGRKRMGTATPLNVAFADNLEVALTGVYPDYVLDYSKVRISDGSLNGGGTVALTYSDGEISLTWDTTTSVQLGTSADDSLYVVAYHPEQDEFLTAATPPVRGDGTLTFGVPAHLQQGQLHVWYFMANRKQTRVSRSSYLGVFEMD